MYSQVKEFIDAYSQTAYPTPAALKGVDKLLRLNLHEEEAVKEFLNILDSLYVILGTAITMGISEEQLRDGFQAVHENNMSKLWTQEEIEANHGVFDFQKTLNGRYIAKNSQGKVIKSPSHLSAKLHLQLEAILETT